MDGERESVYVSGRVGEEAQTRDFIERLEGLGLEVSVDWTTLGVKKPYLEHREHNEPLAREMLMGAYDADYFILLEQPGLLGARYEGGAALTAAVLRGDNLVFIVGEDIRESAFYTLSNVELVADAEELFDRLAEERLNRVH